MNILLIHNHYRYRGGEDRYVDILAETLQHQGHNVSRFQIHSSEAETYSTLKRLTIPFRLIHSPQLNRRLETQLKTTPTHLAVVHNLSPLLSYSLLKVLKRRRVPVLKRLENFKFLCLNGLFMRNDFRVCEDCKQGNFSYGVLRRCYQHSFAGSFGLALADGIHRLRKTVVGNVDLFLASSQLVKTKYVEAGFPEHKILVRPNFIDFQPQASVDHVGDYAVYLGRLSREKGIMTLLDAFQQLPDIPLRIIGAGPLETDVKAYLQNKGMSHVQLTGFLDGDAKIRMLKGARFLIFPSHCYESFGYTVAEGFACGLPAVVAGTGSAVELVDEGENGFVFQTGNPDDLAQKVRLIHTLPAERIMHMKTAALQKAVTHYSRPVGQRHIQDILPKVIDAASKK